MSVPQASANSYDADSSFYNLSVASKTDLSGVLANDLWFNITTGNSGILRSVTIYVQPQLYEGTGKPLGTMSVNLSQQGTLGIWTTIFESDAAATVTDTSASMTGLSMSLADPTGIYRVRVAANTKYRVTVSYTAGTIGVDNILVGCSDYSGCGSNCAQIYQSNAAIALQGLPSSASLVYPACGIQLAADGGWTGYSPYMTALDRTRFQQYMMTSNFPPGTAAAEHLDQLAAYYDWDNPLTDTVNTIGPEQTRWCTNPVPSIGANNCDGWVNPVWWTYWAWDPLDEVAISADTLNNSVIPNTTPKSIYGLPGNTVNTQQQWGGPYRSYTNMAVCDQMEDPSKCPVPLQPSYNQPFVFMDLQRPALPAGWSEWGPWSECTATCGGGMQYQTRTCTNPAPIYNAPGCTGNIIQSRPCNTGACSEPVCPVAETPSYTYVSTPHTTVYQSDGTTTPLVVTDNTVAPVVPTVQKNYTIWLLILIVVIVAAMTLGYVYIDDQPYMIV